MKQQKQGRDKQGQQVVMAAMAVGYLLPAEQKKHSWSKPFDNGQVRVIFYVEENPIRNSYRVLVANRFYRPDERQWLDADQIPQAIKTLQDVQKAHKKARRHLEGGVIRRLFRLMF
jgi:hypothetical protein